MTWNNVIRDINDFFHARKGYLGIEVDSRRNPLKIVVFDWQGVSCDNVGFGFFGDSYNNRYASLGMARCLYDSQAGVKDNIIFLENDIGQTANDILSWMNHTFHHLFLCYSIQP